MGLRRAIGILLSRKSSLVVLAVAAAYSMNFFYAVWLVSVAVDRSVELGSLAAMVLMLPMTLLAFPLGWLSDLVGRRGVLLGAVACNVVVVASPTLSRGMLTSWLIAALLLTGVSNAAWSAVGVASVIDSVNERSQLIAHRRIVVLGFGIDGGKLAAAGVLILAEPGHLMLVRIITTLLSLVMVSGAAIKAGGSARAVPAQTTLHRKSVWLLMFIFAGALAVQELSGTQQAGMVAIAGVVSSQGAAMANFTWVLGALLGNGMLLLIAPLNTRYLLVSFVVYGAGFMFLATGGASAIAGIFLNGVGAALLWQTVRATVIRDFPERYRGRFTGIVGAIENVAMALGTVLILHGAAIWGYRLVFAGSTVLVLFTIIPVVLTMRAPASVRYEG